MTKFTPLLKGNLAENQYLAHNLNSKCKHL